MEVWKGILWTGLGLALVAVIVYLIRRNLLKGLRSNNEIDLGNLDTRLVYLSDLYSKAKLILAGLKTNCDIGLWKNKEAVFLEINLETAKKEFEEIRQNIDKSFSAQKLLKQKARVLERKLEKYADILYEIEEIPSEIIKAKNMTHSKICEIKEMVGGIDTMVTALNGILHKLKTKIDDCKNEFEREIIAFDVAEDKVNWFNCSETFSELWLKVKNIKNEVEHLHQKRKRSIKVLIEWPDRVTNLTEKRAVGGQEFCELMDDALEFYDQATLILGNYPDYESIVTDWDVVGRLLIDADDRYGRAQAIYEMNKLWKI